MKKKQGDEFGGYNHCVQCGELLSPWLEADGLFICQQADCPNFGLLQLGIENMPKEP